MFMPVYGFALITCGHPIIKLEILPVVSAIVRVNEFSAPLYKEIPSPGNSIPCQCFILPNIVFEKGGGVSFRCRSIVTNFNFLFSYRKVNPQR